MNRKSRGVDPLSEHLANCDLPRWTSPPARTRRFSRRAAEALRFSGKENFAENVQFVGYPISSTAEIVAVAGRSTPHGSFSFTGGNWVQREPKTLFH